MDITCSKCGTEYVLDDTLISKSGTKVRCMTCNHVFKVYRNSDTDPDQWVLRQTHGPIRTFTKLAKIQEWISEGKVTMDDLISRKNGPWKKIGDIAELKALFEQSMAKRERRSAVPSRPKNPVHVRSRKQTRAYGSFETPAAKIDEPPARKTDPPLVVPKATEITSDVPTPLATPKVPEVPEVDETAGTTRFEPVKHVADLGRRTFSEEPPRLKDDQKAVEPDFSQIPADAAGADWTSGDNIGVSDPKWTDSKKVPKYDVPEEPLPPPRRVGRYVALGVFGVLVLAGFFCFVFVPDIGKSIFARFDTMVSEPKPDRYQKFFDRGQESFLIDSDAAFLQADREFQKVLALEENHPETLAALAKLYAVWAQYLEDAKLDAMADALGAGEDMPKDVERLDREFQSKLGEATRWSNLALHADAHSKTALLALADIYRMKGELEKAAEYLKKASDIQFDAETKYISVLIDIAKRDPAEGLIKRLSDLTANTPMIRALYLQARLLASTGEKEKAVAVLDRLLTLNANHDRARELKQRINADKPVWMVEADRIAAVENAKLADAAKSGEKGEAKSRGDEKSSESEPSTRGVGGMLLRAKRLQKRGRPDEAKEMFDKVLEISPTNLDAHAGLGYYYLDKGAPGNAIASFRRCLTVSPKFGPAIIGLAETYKVMGRKDQALKQYRAYLQYNPTGSQADMARRNIAKLDESGGATASDNDVEERPEGAEETNASKASDLMQPEATGAESKDADESKSAAEGDANEDKTPPAPSERRVIILDETPEEKPEEKPKEKPEIPTLE